jgi:hypothetical protein
MALKLIIKPSAEVEISEALEYYNYKIPSSVKALDEELHLLLQKIMILPELYQLVYRNICRGLLKTFPYGVYETCFTGSE